MAEIHRFPDTSACTFAKRKAEKGHREWIIWHLADGSTAAARMTAETIATAIREGRERDGKPLVYGVQKTAAILYGGSRAMWETIRRNYAAGHLS